jgi:hypothetical protein
MATPSPDQGGLFWFSSFSKKLSSVLENIFAKSISSKCEASINYELSRTFNAPAKIFAETSIIATDIISSVGDLETNFPLYISDYFDQLSDWSREHTHEQARIGSNISGLQDFMVPYPAGNPNGLELALSGTFGKNV